MYGDVTVYPKVFQRLDGFRRDYVERIKTHKMPEYKT